MKKFFIPLVISFFAVICKAEIVSIVTEPAGSNTQVQYNNNGEFGGDSDFTFNGTTVTATKASISTGTIGNLTLTVGAGSGKIPVSDASGAMTLTDATTLTVATATYATNATTASYVLSGSGMRRQISITISGGGSVIQTGPANVYVRVPCNMTITGWDIISDQSGSVVVDLWKDAYANFPPTVADSFAGTEKPMLSSAQKNQDTSLSSMTTTLSAGEYIEANIDSAETVTKIIITLYGVER